MNLSFNRKSIVSHEFIRDFRSFHFYPYKNHSRENFVHWKISSVYSPSKNWYRKFVQRTVQKYQAEPSLFFLVLPKVFMNVVSLLSTFVYLVKSDWISNVTILRSAVPRFIKTIEKLASFDSFLFFIAKSVKIKVSRWLLLLTQAPRTVKKKILQVHFESHYLLALSSLPTENFLSRNRTRHIFLKHPGPCCTRDNRSVDVVDRALPKEIDKTTDTTKKLKKKSFVEVTMTPVILCHANICLSHPMCSYSSIKLLGKTARLVSTESFSLDDKK